MTRGYVAAAVVAVLLFVVLTGDAAAAHRRPPAAAGPVVASWVTDTDVCADALEVRYSALVLDGPADTSWAPWRDDGTPILEAHETTADVWVQVEYAADGGSRQGMLRWAGYGQSTGQGASWDLVRVLVAGRRSPEAQLRAGCTP
jgi:hypothetical protein